jgi:hypothetical protein
MHSHMTLTHVDVRLGENDWKYARLLASASGTIDHLINLYPEVQLVGKKLS